MKSTVKTICYFYRDGFGSMVVGRNLWQIILIKLFVIFAVIKLFFFPDFLKHQFSTDQQRADYVMENLTRPVETDNGGEF